MSPHFYYESDQRMKTAKPLKVHLLFALFQVNHTVLLSTLGDSSYRFGATYVGSKQMGPAEVRCSEVTLIPSREVFIFSLWVNCDVTALLFLFSFFQSCWETWTTVAALTPRSSTRSPAEYDPKWLSR